MSRPTVLAAGGVLWRKDSADPEVAVIHRPRYDDWSLPKGKAKPGEHLLVTALREMSEETGHSPRIGARLPVTVGMLLLAIGAVGLEWVLGRSTSQSPHEGLSTSRKRGSFFTTFSK